MKPRFETRLALPLAVPLWALCLALLLALPADLGAATPRKTAAGQGLVTVNFVNADVEAVARAFSAMVNRPIVVDPRVKGNITVASDQPQSTSQAWRSFQTALRGLGFSIVESGGLFKIVPEADAKLQAGTVAVSQVPAKGESIITQIFPLRYENPNNLVAVLRPLISANNTINANPGSNALVITDYADNLQRIARIIAALDQPAGTDVDVIPLQHAVAADLAPLVQRLTDGGGATVPGAPVVAGTGGATTIIPDTRSNSLMVRASNPARLAQVRATIERLDKPSNLVGAGGGLWVVYLKNADAVKLATVVRAAFGALAGSGNASGSGFAASPVATAPLAAAGGGANQPGVSAQATAPVRGSEAPVTGGFIQADPASNSLIITAPEPLYKQVRALIDQLDVRRAQVYIESMIVEVSGGDAADFGFQWQSLLARSNELGLGVAGGTNFTPVGGTGNIIDVNTAAAAGRLTLGSGFNLGILSRVNGIISLAAIARAMQTQANTNVISTPNLVTLDNEEAKIVVGDNVPFITGQFTNTGASGGSTINPFQTIERKDVGITLRIRPQIGESGAVRMNIFQEQSSLRTDTAAGTTNAGPSTTKRSIENTVVVDDGQILVLGGLIEDRFETQHSKVPVLGDIPLLGQLFRSESRTRKRTNLMVFLRPIVMRDSDAATRFSTDRYEQLRGRQGEAQPPASAVVPVNEAPVLPQPTRPAPAPTVQPSGHTPRPQPAAGTPGNPTPP